MATPTKLEILVSIDARLNEAIKAQEQLRRLREEQVKANAEQVRWSALLRPALGFGSTLELAQRGIGIFREAVVESVREVFRLAVATKTTAENLHIDLGAFQALSVLASKTGSDVGVLTEVLEMQQQSMAEARDTTSSAASALRVLGLDYSRLQAMRPEQQLEAIARALQGASDQEEAFAAASELLGTHHVRNLRAALDSLATQGFDKVKSSAEGATRFMSAQTVTQLNTVVGRMRDIWTGVGENWDKFLAKLGTDIASFSTLFVEAAPAPPPPEKTDAQKEAEAKRYAQQTALEEAKQRISTATLDLGVIKGDPTLTADERNNTAVAPLMAQRDALNEILALRGENAEWLAKKIDSLERMAEALRLPAHWDANKAGQYWSTQETLTRLKGVQAAGRMSLDFENKETDLERNDEVAKIRAELAGVQHEIARSQGAGTRSDFAVLRDNYEKFRNPTTATVVQGDSPRLSARRGIEAGLMRTAMDAGTAGEQIASTLQSSIGATVSSISDGIYGWITGAHSFADSMRNLGATVLRTVLDTIVQMGVQMLVVAAIKKAVHAEDTANTKKETAGNAISAFFKTVAQLGPIWGTVAFAAAAASIMAMFGGFREQGGPVEAGRAYIVGERRPEVFVPTQSGTILPSVDTMRVRGGMAAGPGRAAAGSAAARGAMVAGAPRVYLALASSQQQFEEMRRLPGYDVHIVDTVHRHRGSLLG